MGAEPIAILAGAGDAPAAAFALARSSARAAHVFAFAETGAPGDLARAGVPHEVVSLGRPQTLLDLLHATGAREALLIGKFPKDLHAAPLEFDDRALAILARLPTRADHDLFAAVADELASEGIHVVSQAAFLAPLLVAAGTICGGGIPPGKEPAARHALDLARELARLGVGQALAIKDGLVVAVEAAEHTDEMIRRAGRLASAGLWIAKAAGTRADDRFDVPAVGPGTVQVMAEARAAMLILEAGRVFLFDREETVRAAERAGLAIVALE